MELSTVKVNTWNSESFGESESIRPESFGESEYPFN